LISSLVAVGGSKELPDPRWTPLPTFRLVARYPFDGRRGEGVSAGLGGSGSPHIIRSSGREELAVDVGGKYAAECSVDCCATLGRLIDGVVMALSLALVCVAYPSIGLCSGGVGDKIITHIVLVEKPRV